MTWKPVAAIPVLFAQINAKWPDRDKTTDGVIGDAAHQARPSDHNPDSNGWVHAMDIDKDFAPSIGGDDAEELADQLLTYARTKQPGSGRLKNIVFRDRVASGTYADQYWVWRRNDALEHFDHIHISFTDGTELDARPFNIPILEEDVALTQEEINKIVDGVWAKAVPTAWDGKSRSTANLLSSIQFYAISGGFNGNVPATGTTSPGGPTMGKQIMDAINADSGSATGDLSDATIAKIADAVAAELAVRLTA